MGTHRLDKIREVFLIARDLSPERRAALLTEKCGGDASILKEVEELLIADDKGGFLPETVEVRSPIHQPPKQHAGPAIPAFAKPAPPAIEGYRVLLLLGQGGMGTVWKALQISTNRPVALKLMSAALFASDRAKARFTREVELAARLQHPNVARIYDGGQTPTAYYYAMELVDGQRLDTFVKERKLSERQILILMRRVCAGLQHAHEKGVIHRDLKPANILVDQDGQPRILDFGIAKAVAEDAANALTADGEVAGTPAYMSPEQIKGEQVDARSDIFTFGIVLYEALTGTLPFSKDSHGEIMAAILRDDPAPLEASAGVCAVVHRCLRKQPTGRFQSMNEVRAALKQAAGVTADRAPSIAVLPFANMSVDAGDEYFADGLAEEIINALTHVSGLKVIARTSAFAFKGKNADIRKIARALGVSNVLEGSVRRAGKQLRITAQLIRASDGTHLWSHRYDREMIDVFAIQDEIALAIAEELKVSLTATGGPKKQTHSLPAYEALLQARHHWHKFSTGGWARAQECFQRALSIDPNYAAAHAGMASYYGALASVAMAHPKDALPRARAAAEKALSLDSSLAEAHAILGVVSGIGDYDWAQAGNHFRRALELDRHSASVCVPYAIWYLRPRGRLEEALAELKLLRERDPLSVMARNELSLMLFLMRDYEASAAMAQQALDLEPNHNLALLQLVRVRLAQNRFEEAITLAEQTADRKWLVSLAHLVAAYQAAGRSTDAQTCLAEMHALAAQLGYVHATPFATTYAALGEVEPAMEWVEKAIELREPMITLLKTWPVFDPLRSHPRYPAMLEMMNLA
ncbi:MAG TPA: protein kinase [Tepidisphaeraceae bacterium]|jgi:serine/threonine-protein kinase